MDAPTILLGMAVAAVYVALCRWLVKKQGRLREITFALLNIGIVFYFFFWDSAHPMVSVKTMGVYLLIVLGQYLVLDHFPDRPGWISWIGFLLPIGILVVFRMQPMHSLFKLTGLSYLAFRTSYLVLEVRNGIAKKPNVWEYFGFAFFAPTLSVGPISPYSLHRQAFAGSGRSEIPVGRALLRVIVGMVKYRFLGAICDQLTYFPMLATGQVHHRIDVVIAAVAYYLYLYCNFSGFCDIAIGGAGLMGISVAENFDNPFAARNIKDYWNRWHITLSHYMRDVVFSPLSKALVRLLGPARINHAVAISVFVVFLLIGVWHGVGWKYAAFGMAHGLALVVNLYYTLMLKRWLGKDMFAAYNRNPLIRAVAVALTFSYVTAALFIFHGNTEVIQTVRAIFGSH